MHALGKNTKMFQLLLFFNGRFRQTSFLVCLTANTILNPYKPVISIYCMKITPNLTSHFSKCSKKRKCCNTESEIN